MRFDAGNIDIHALLTDEYVAVANRGQPFTKEGLIALCQTDISPKGRENIFNSSSRIEDARGLLKKIRCDRLNAYKSCPGDIEEHANKETSLRDEYAGRILPELLQNAHDARAKKKIGRKGIGFKAVLNICNRPRIHSGPLHCYFDAQHSSDFLKKREMKTEKAPVLRLPFLYSQEQEPAPIQELIEKYDTVIVLPFTDNQSRERFLPHWEKCAKDGRLLLFLESDGLNRIVWERNDETGISKYDWSRRVEDGHVEIHGNTPDKQIDEHWRIYKSKRAAVAVNLKDTGSPGPEIKRPYVRVFFETKECSPLPLLIHAEFPLKQGRDNVSIEAGSVGETAEEVADRVYDALSAVSDPGVFLDMLKPRIKPNEMDNIENQLWGAFKTRLSGISIPSANQVQLSQVRLRPEHRRWGYDCNLWNDFKSILHKHNREQFLQLPLLPPGVDTDDREDTILLFNPDARLSKEEINELAFLPVTEYKRFVPTNNTNIFFPTDNKPPPAPPGVEIRLLEHNFVELIKTHRQKNNLKKILLNEFHVSEFKPLGLLEAILPILCNTDVEQPARLIDFLFSAVEPELADEDIIFNWKEPARKKVSELLKLPVRGGDERPVKEVYAGSDWTGNDFLEKAYGNNNERDFLKSPPSDEEEKKRWQRFYQWLGVGWCPKIMPILCFYEKAGTKEGSLWKNDQRNGYFSVEPAPHRWREYCKSLPKEKSNDPCPEYTPRMRQNWSLDGGEAILSQDGAFSIIGNNWKYFKQYETAIGFQSSNKNKDNDQHRWSCQSYFIWLLKNNAWIPVKEIAEKQNPKDVFQNPEVSIETGGWTYQNQDDAEKDFLEAIGVRSGWKAINSEDWKHWLQAAAGLSKEQIHSRKENVKSLYLAALRHWRDNNRDHYSGPLWGIMYRDDKEEWRLSNGRNDIYFVDRPDLTNLQIPGLCIFPEQAILFKKEAENKLQLKRLSEYLSGKPVEPEEIKERSNQLSQRIESRLDIINAYLDVKFKDDKSNFHSTRTPEVKVVKRLNVSFEIGGRTIHDQELNAYLWQNNSDGHQVLWLNDKLFDNNKPGFMIFEYIASALGYAEKVILDEQSCIKDLLLYEDWEIEKKLIHLGCPKETIEQIVSNKHEPQTRHEETEITTTYKSEKTERTTIQETPEASTGTGQTKYSEQFNESNESHSFDTRVTHSRHINRNHNASSRTSSRGTTSAPNYKAGIETQERIRKSLQEHLEPHGWWVSPGTTHDEQQRETDIELNHEQHGTYHVEVKHCESGYVYWSEKEVSKALKHHGRYLMVIVQGGDEKHQQYWIINPTNELILAPRKGVWEWRSRRFDVSYQPEQDNPWAIPCPREEHSADRFSFKIDVKRWIAEREPNHCPLFDLDRETNTLTD